MKMEGGGVATSSAATVLHKIKVKEEAKECCSGVLPQPAAGGPPSSSSAASGASSPPPPRGAPGVAIGAIATITISSGCGGELAAAVAAKQSAADAFPVDLDLKSRTRGATRDKLVAREDVANGTESRGSSSPSPSSSPGSHGQPQQQQQAKSSGPRQRAASSTASSARSPDSDDASGGQPSVKAEVAAAPEEPGHRLDEARCIAGAFAGHDKLKRLLGTLVQFAMDISPDTGDTVRTLVLSLLSGSMSAEDFHSALQEATNYPLRGFVLPYLKHTLPSLQRDLSVAARADNQTCAQYLRSNESAVLEAVGLVAPAGSSESVEPFAEHALGHPGAAAPGHPAAHAYPMRPGVAGHSPVIAAGPHLAYAHPASKRRASDALYYENGGAFEEGAPYAKRGAWAHHPHQHHQQQQHQQPPPQTSAGVHSGHPDAGYCWYAHPLPGSHHASLLPSLVQTGYAPLGQPSAAPTAHLPHQPALGHGSGSGQAGGATQNGSASLDDEWKNIHVMLNCILGMVEKTKRALAILQRRGCSSPAAAAPASGPGLQAATANGAQSAAMANGAPQQLEAAGPDRDGTFKRLSGEIVAQTIRATEDRVAEVKRRAEEAVQEVKRAAVAEMQRAVAVAVAESRAAERLRSQRYLDSGIRSHAQHGRPSPFLRLAEATTRTPGMPTAPSSTGSSAGEDADKEATHLPGSMSSNCWNCGRPALETCGGCGVARYCGSFCQHRDWEAGGHHASCATTSAAGHHHQQQQSQQPHERARSSTPSPPRSVSATSGEADQAAGKATAAAAAVTPGTGAALRPAAK